MTDQSTKFTGVLLAGGNSLRLGQDKALLRINNQPLWQHCQDALSSCCDQLLVAGNRPDLAAKNRPCFPDEFPGSALAGIHTGLIHAPTDWVTLLPCDLPFPSPKLLRKLQHAATGDVEAVVPKTRFGREPLIACYHKRILPKVIDRLTTKRLKVLDLLDDIKTSDLNEDALPDGWRRSLRNINTPTDLEKLDEVPPVVSFIAHSGTGKTTLIEKLIGELRQNGWTVGALKHDAHHFDIDHRGKDSWRMTQAGAAITAISSSEKTAIIEQHMLPLPLEEMLEPFRGKVDIVLTEGFGQCPLPKIELFRAELNQPLSGCGEKRDPNLIAIASNVDFAVDVPAFNLDNPVDLVQFIEDIFLA